MPWFKNFFNRNKNTSQSETGTALLRSYSSSAGGRRGREQLLAAYEQIPELRAVVHHTSSTVASVKWRLYRRQGKDRKDWIELEEHPLLALLERPNSILTGRTARQTTVASLDLIGESAWVIKTEEVNGTVRPTSAYPIPGTWIARRPSAENPTWDFDSPSLIEKWTDHPDSLVLYFCDPSVRDPYGRGSGIGMALADELDIVEHSTRTVSAFFQNSAMPSAIITVTGASEAQAQRAAVDWRNRFQGARNAFGTMFTGAETKINRLDTSFKDQNLIEIRKQLRDLIHQSYGVPPEKLGTVLGSNRQGSETADRIDAKDVMVPRLEILKEQFQRLADLFEAGLSIEYESPVPDDLEHKRQMMQILPGRFSINEEREIAGYPPIDGGEARMMPQGATLSAEPGLLFPVKNQKSTITDIPIFTANLIKVLPISLVGSQIKSVLSDVVEKVGTEVHEEVIDAQGPREEKAAADGDTPTFDFSTAELRSWLSEKQKTIAYYATEKARAKAQDVIRQGLIEGLSLSEIKAKIAEAFGQIRTENTRTAEAAVASASQKAEIEGLRQTGIKMKKQWLDTPDGRTRDAHTRLGDQDPIELEDKFIIKSGTWAGAAADAPGLFGVPALDINCRCAVITLIEEDKRDGKKACYAISTKASRQEKEEAWERRNIKRTRFINKMAVVLDSITDTQERAVIDYLESNLGNG